VNTKPTVAVAAIATGPSLPSITLASSHGVTVSLPTPHSQASETAVSTRATRIDHADVRKSCTTARLISTGGDGSDTSDEARRASR
jgi:hypothetical protein